MKRLSTLLLLIILIFPFRLFSQPADFLTGKVLNSVTGEPLPFASILVKNSNLGVFSNADGDFRIANNPIFQRDSLLISFIGFKRFSMPFKKLREGKTNIIYLKPADFQLSEVNVVADAKKLNPKSIIRRAIQQIPENSPDKSFNYVGYYRDYQKKGKSYYNLDEAIVQTLDSGISRPSTETRYRLLKYNENPDFPRFDLPQNYDASTNDKDGKTIKYGTLPDQGGNELFVLMAHDPIRNFRSPTFSFVNTLSKDFIANHHFSAPVPVYDNNLMLYKIGFTARRYFTGDSLLVSGNIFIQPINYAIHKLEYSGFYLKSRGERKKMFDIEIEYGRSDPAGRMELKYISFNNIFDVADPNDTTAFRVIKTDVLTVDPKSIRAVLQFNHAPDAASAGDEENYQVQLNGQKVSVLGIKVFGRKVILDLKDKGTIKPRLAIDLRNIKDIKGKVLDQKRRLEFYQYRELFVQEFNRPLAFTESCLMQNQPLKENCISKYAGAQKYWMNTPFEPDTANVDQADKFPAVDLNPEYREDNAVSGKLPQEMPETRVAKISLDSKDKTPIAERLDGFRQASCPDQVFVQLDRSLYRPGDTVYFQAYVRNRFTGTFESKSPVLYALLFDSQKTLADSARFRVLESTASGWLVIPEKSKPGKYRFTAFTGAMQNYDPSEAFELDIRVKERGSTAEKVEIVFNKQQYNPKDTLVATIRITDPSGAPAGKQKFRFDLVSGDESSESDDAQTDKFGRAIIRLTLPDSVTSRPRLKIRTKKGSEESILKEVSIPYEDPYFELRFLPEGGTFITGLTQRVGFNAANYKGQPEPIEGLLKDHSGVILDTIRSGKYGPGEFSCLARPGLYVELINSSVSQKIWPLPTPETGGISLQVSPKDERSFTIEVQSDHYTGEPVTVSCVMNATPVLEQELTLDKKQRLVVETNALPAGVAQITVFDKNFKPLAERLIYVNADKHLRFSIKTDSVSEAESELSISVTDGQGAPKEGIFSISVVDSLRGTDPELFTPGIAYTMNYHPYLLSNLPAKVLAEGLDNMSDQERDLLFLVYGWSRYNWKLSPEKNPAERVDYDRLKMKVLYASKKRRSDRGLDLVSLEGPSMKHLVTDANGEISMPLDSLPEATRSVTLMPVVKDRNSARGAMLSIPYNEQYFKSEKLFTPQPTIPLEEYKVYNAYQHIPLDEKTIEIPTVTITAYPKYKKVYQNEYDEQYKNAFVRSSDPEVLRTAFSIEDVIRTMYNPISVTKDRIILRPATSFTGGPVESLIVLDGQPLYSDGFSSIGWPAVRTIPPQEVTSITILIGRQGIARYGLAAQNGIIFINTCAANPSLRIVRSKWVAQDANDKMLVPIEIYRPYKEFYKPTKREEDPAVWSLKLPTIYWNPEVYFDGKEPVRIKVRNPKYKGPVSVVVNGVSFSDDLMGSGKAGYLIR